MRIKKINEDKVQIIITNQDLEERDFKKWELMPLSPKAQEFFQDILDMAYEECGFEIEDDSQLVVEAYPLSVDSFVVVMTKVQASYHSELGNLQQLQQEDGGYQLERDAVQLWMFDDLETCSQLCSRLDPTYVESSTLYKYENQYCLALTVRDMLTEITALLGEYGEWLPVDESFMKEYGKVLIQRSAVANIGSLIQ